MSLAIAVRLYAGAVFLIAVLVVLAFPTIYGEAEPYRLTLCYTSTTQEDPCAIPYEPQP